MYLYLPVCWCFLAGYVWIILSRWYSWQKLPLFKILPHQPVTRLSVLIPVRNEAGFLELLLSDLEAQTYPRELFEVLIIDDHSEDNTVTIVTSHMAATQLNLRIISLKDYPGFTQKKAAIAVGVKAATGELIVQTDGDCRVSGNWLKVIGQFYEVTGARCISGPVCLTGNNSLFTGMQVVEFAGLIGIGGASIASGHPNMCNGANFAYNRESFSEVQGFTGNEHLASGDDEFLMHKLAHRYPGQVHFLKAAEAVVFTGAKISFKAFVNQRVRWASKWPSYSLTSIKGLAILVFGVNLLIFLSLFFWLSGLLSGWQTIVLYSIKFLTDGFFLMHVLYFFNRTKYIWYILPLQIFYIPYVLVTALLGLKGNYSWKGRQVN